MLFVIMFPVAVLMGSLFVIPICLIYFSLKYYFRERMRFGMTEGTLLINGIEKLSVIALCFFFGVFIFIFLS